MLPEKVTPPIYTVIIIKICWKKLSGTEVNSDQAIKNVAKPPKPLNKATISGIEVILTFKAINAPTIAPVKIPANKIRGLTKLNIVTKTAMNIAEADKKFPLTAVSSLPSIFIPEINKIDENIYAIFWIDTMVSGDMFILFLFKHFKHSISY